MLHLTSPHMALPCCVQRAQKQREEIGVELYGFQQSLAKLQLLLERAQGSYASAQEERLKVRPLAQPCIASTDHPCAPSPAHVRKAKP